MLPSLCPPVRRWVRPREAFPQIKVEGVGLSATFPAELFPGAGSVVFETCCAASLLRVWKFVASLESGHVGVCVGLNHKMLTPPAITRPRPNRVVARMSHRILTFERVSTVCVIGGIVGRVYGAMLGETTETRLCTFFVITAFFSCEPARRANATIQSVIWIGVSHLERAA